MADEDNRMVDTLPRLCPQCHQEENVPSNRLISDSCGHQKCRLCLMREVDGCFTCKVPTQVDTRSQLPAKVTYIKYDGEPDRARVITKLENYQATVETTKLSYTVLENYQPEIDTSEFNYSVNQERINNDDKTKSVVNSTIQDLAEQDDNAQKSKKKISFPSYIRISDNSPKYTCTLCKKSFTTRLHIRYHFYCDGSKKPFKCNQCLKEFITKSHYDYHIRNHDGTRPYVCTICNKGFNQQSKLTRHALSHSVLRPFVCESCGQTFKSLDGLKNHNRTHLVDKPHQCNLCGARFIELANLRKHSIKHTGEKNFMCDTCGRKFGLKNTLNAHIRTHTNNRPYGCDGCSRLFSSKKELRRHILIHKNLRYYSCPKCSQTFTRRDNYDRHMKNTHSKRGLPPIVLTPPTPPQSPRADEAMENNVHAGIATEKIQTSEQGSGEKSSTESRSQDIRQQEVVITSKSSDVIASGVGGRVKDKPWLIPSPSSRQRSESLSNTGCIAANSDCGSNKTESLSRATPTYQAVPVINRSNVSHSKGSSSSYTSYEGANCVPTITRTSNVQSSHNLVSQKVPTIVSPPAKEESGASGKDMAESKATETPPTLRLYLSDLHWRKRTMELLNLRNELKADSLVYDKSLEKVSNHEERILSHNQPPEAVEFSSSSKHADEHGNYYSKQTFYKMPSNDIQQMYLPHNRLRHMLPKSIDYVGEQSPQSSTDYPNIQRNYQGNGENTSLITLANVAEGQTAKATATIAQAKRVIVEHRSAVLPK